MSEGLQKWGNAKFDDGYGKGYRKGELSGMQPGNSIYAELLVGASKKDVCRKLDVDVQHVDTAHKILHAKKSPSKCAVSEPLPSGPNKSLQY